MSHPRDSGSVSDAAEEGRSTPAPAHAPLLASSLGEENEVSGRLAQDPANSGGRQPPSPAARKRRRITRACDDCRRKKIKCDGGRPCASCADFSSDCTYNRPSARDVSTKPKEVQVLEDKLQRAEALLRRFVPDLEFENPVPPALAGRRPPSSAAVNAGRDDVGSRSAATATAAAEATSDRARFIPLVERTGQLDLTDTGEYVFHGQSSGAAFLSRISQQFPGLVRYDSRTPFLPQPHRPFLASPMEGLPVYSANPHWQANYDYARLPPRNLAHALCEYSFSRASCILRVVHAPSFQKMFDKLYEEQPKRYTHEERRFVGLLFSVMALGSMYDVDENDPTNPDHYAVAIDRGNKYYISARLHLQDITECGDMTTLQALIFIIQFLQATGNLSGCHTLIGIALRSALRMGLHRHLPHTSMTPIKDETRRRVFYTIRQMDIYLCTTLGLPLLLQDKDIDQPLPTEVDDENITESAILRPPRGTPSFLEAFNAHNKLMRILATVVEHLYPPKGMDGGETDVTYMISGARIREIEQDLNDWHEQLPPIWRPGPEEDTQITRYVWPSHIRDMQQKSNIYRDSSRYRDDVLGMLSLLATSPPTCKVLVTNLDNHPSVRILLRFAYAHVQLMLYRPFLQSYSHQGSAPQTTDERHLAFATTGINVCRNIIHIGLEIRRQAVLIGPYWFITYTQFIAVLSVVLYVLDNPDKPGASELIADAKLGRDCISGLTQRSLAADKVAAALNSLFDQLPSQFKSTSPLTFGGNLSPVLNDRNAGVRSQADPVARQPTRPTVSRPYNGWGLNSPTAPNSRPSTAQHRSSMRSAPESSNNLGREATDVTDFPMGDPFAYPIVPGVSLGDDSFTTIHEDTMRLPVYSMHTDLEEQLMYLQDPAAVPPRTSMPASANEYLAVSHAIPGGLNYFDNGPFWGPPGYYGSRF